MWLVGEHQNLQDAVEGWHQLQCATVFGYTKLIGELACQFTWSSVLLFNNKHQAAAGFPWGTGSTHLSPVLLRDWQQAVLGSMQQHHAQGQGWGGEQWLCPVGCSSQELCLQRNNEVANNRHTLWGLLAGRSTPSGTSRGKQQAHPVGSSGREICLQWNNKVANNRHILSGLPAGRSTSSRRTRGKTVGMSCGVFQPGDPPPAEEQGGNSGHALWGLLARNSASSGTTRGLAPSAACVTSNTPVSPVARLTTPSRTTRPQVAATEEQQALHHRTSHSRLK